MRYVLQDLTQGLVYSRQSDSLNWQSEGQYVYCLKHNMYFVFHVDYFCTSIFMYAQTKAKNSVMKVAQLFVCTGSYEMRYIIW